MFISEHIFLRERVLGQSILYECFRLDQCSPRHIDQNDALLHLRQRAVVQDVVS